MAINKQHIFDPGIYFITFTNYKWLPLFEITQSYDLVYKWFDALQKDGNHMIGYVIMPNHVHVLPGFIQNNQSINTIVGNGKRFMGYEMIGRLQRTNNDGLLTILAEGVAPADKRKGKLHEIFEPSFDLKLCRSYSFVQQKLDYIHANPVSKKWNLVTDFTEYIHSSAKYYATGKQGIYPVVHVHEWMYRYWA